MELIILVSYKPSQKLKSKYTDLTELVTCERTTSEFGDKFDWLRAKIFERDLVLMTAKTIQSLKSKRSS